MKEKNKQEGPRKVSMFWFRVAQTCSKFIASMWFKRKFVRNEVKGKKGPFVIIANHQAALDFANLIGVTREHITFVISNSFFNTVPIKKQLDKAGMIPKQQFQTGINDMRRMREVLDCGGILALYPAGLMCEDGLSTPIPDATYRFLRWLGTDVYMARTEGSYFVMPKWSRKKRPGRTFLDVYKLFSKEELTKMPIDELKTRANEALLFDAYRDQERNMVKYRGCENIEGLENVLYKCPHCLEEFSIKVKDVSTIYCEACGFEQKCDEYGFLHKTSEVGEEIRYVSDWSRRIYSDMKDSILSGEYSEIEADANISMIDYDKHKFVEVGRGTLKITREHITLLGNVKGERVDISLPTAMFPSMPFGPGRYVELQNGEDIYRCVLDDGRLAMKMINTVKVYYELAISGHSTQK